MVQSGVVQVSHHHQPPLSINVNELFFAGCNLLLLISGYEPSNLEQFLASASMTVVSAVVIKFQNEIYGMIE